MKKKFIFALIAVLVLGALVFRATQKTTTNSNEIEKKSQQISVRSFSDNKQYRQNTTYPGLIVGDQQITLTAGANGTITALNFDIGKSVRLGQRLATIDISGTTSAPGANGLKSGQVRSLELAVESAQESYKRAKDAYKEDDTYANKKDKEIAEIAVSSAEAALQSALDGQFVTAPISGTVIERSVSVGDSIAIGQPIATISKTGLAKIQFYVSADDLPFIKIGMPLTITVDEKDVTGTIDIISPQADTVTKRFLVEATPSQDQTLIIGSVASVSFEIIRTTSENDRGIVPLSVVTVGQNENYIFIVHENAARKIPVDIHSVNGETAEISSSSLTPQSQIIFDGSKLVHDGESVTIIQ